MFSSVEGEFAKRAQGFRVCKLREAHLATATRIRFGVVALVLHISLCTITSSHIDVLFPGVNMPMLKELTDLPIFGVCLGHQVIRHFPSPVPFRMNPQSSKVGT